MRSSRVVVSSPSVWSSSGIYPPARTVRMSVGVFSSCSFHGMIEMRVDQVRMPILTSRVRLLGGSRVSQLSELRQCGSADVLSG